MWIQEYIYEKDEEVDGREGKAWTGRMAWQPPVDEKRLDLIKRVIQTNR